MIWDSCNYFENGKPTPPKTLNGETPSDLICQDYKELLKMFRQSRLQFEYAKYSAYDLKDADSICTFSFM